MKKDNNIKRKTSRFLKKPAAFMDRDGTINYDYGYVYKFSEFKLRPYVLKGLRYLTKKKYLIFIITNQAGIGKGKFNISDFKKLNKKMITFFLKNKIKINEIQFCPYHPQAKIKKYKKKTNLRKPGNLMIINILKKWNVDLKRSFMLGDKKSDRLAAKKSRLYFEYVKRNFYLQVKNINEKKT
tara:strand:- start:1469 stop:2017 length:549 start_codon:yes stop_codon:yes gene_type:complete